MDLGLVIHVVLSLITLFVGYFAGIRAKNKDMALLAAGAQPSVAIAMSLFDLGLTFQNIEGSLASDKIYQALALKMFHMVGGIALGVLQEAWVQWALPSDDADKKTAETVKEAVIQGIASQLKVINDQVVAVGRTMEQVPPQVANANRELIQQTAQTNMQLLKEVVAVNLNTAEKVNQAMLQSTDEVTQNMRTLTTGATSKMQTLLDQHRQQNKESLETAFTSLKNDVSAVQTSFADTTGQMKKDFSTEVIQITSQLQKSSGLMKTEVESTSSKFQQDVSMVRSEVDRDFTKLQANLAQASQDFSDQFKQETQTLATEAASQGSKVILDVAKVVAETLTASTQNSLTAATTVTKAALDVEKAANQLRSRMP